MVMGSVPGERLRQSNLSECKSKERNQKMLTHIKTILKCHQTRYCACHSLSSGDNAPGKTFSLLFLSPFPSEIE